MAYIVYYASAICRPSVMLLASFLLCCLVSFLTGTSFGSAATIGVICMTMADSMGIPSIYTGGAILAGIFFGDRCSPVSTSALLVSELTKTDLFSNIRNMLRSALVPFALSCIIYAVLGWTLHAGTSADSTRNLLQNYYHFTPLMLLPVVLVLVLSLLRIDIKKTIAISVLMGMVLAVTVQHFSISELPALCFSGFSPADKNIAALMGGGGFLSMARVYVIVGISSCYSGMFEGTGFLSGIEAMMKRLSSRITPYGATFLTSVITSAISCNQTLAIMLTDQLCRADNPEKDSFALDLENSANLVYSVFTVRSLTHLYFL
ncbi:Na+/H+ antiporter NhaC family protein [Blautia sp. CLA-JM-H16]|uniref:Na+/H+ antiporter NhaC family protein n=1 Tax=Blautia aquisgranensis TaxID=3133153 RepID=A0ABV1BIT0_9FIRM